MSAGQAFFVELPDAELRALVLDLEGLRATGVMPTELVSNLARRLGERTGIPYRDALTLAQSEPLHITAMRWAHQK